MNPPFTITNTMTNGLAQIERARGFLEAAQLSAAWIRRMSKRDISRHKLVTTCDMVREGKGARHGRYS